MKVAILGPKGTYSEIAALQYVNDNQIDYEFGYFNSIDEAVHSLNHNYDLAIVPIENTLDGYVQKTLDLLLEDDKVIIDQVRVEVSFKLISNNKIEDIEKIYSQFKALGQCTKYLSNLNDIKVINTESNVMSYLLWKENKDKTAAIVPSHLETESKYVVNDITDIINNYTRFFVIKKGNNFNELNGLMRIPLYIIPITEHPGLLFEILKVFNDFNINLTSILSRPKKIIMGEYNFYLEIEATNEQLNNFLSHVDRTNTKFKIKLLGKLKEINYGKTI